MRCAGSSPRVNSPWTRGRRTRAYMWRSGTTAKAFRRKSPPGCSGRSRPPRATAAPDWGCTSHDKSPGKPGATSCSCPHPAAGPASPSRFRSPRRPRAPDVILVDLRMPRMGGIELYAELEQERPELAARVLFLSGDVSQLAEPGNTPVPRERVLVKPVELAELERRIAAFVRERKAS